VVPEGWTQQQTAEKIRILGQHKQVSQTLALFNYLTMQVDTFDISTYGGNVMKRE
jgi:hypothetical protein